MKGLAQSDQTKKQAGFGRARSNLIPEPSKQLEGTEARNYKRLWPHTAAATFKLTSKWMKLFMSSAHQHPQSVKLKVARIRAQADLAWRISHPSYRLTDSTYVQRLSPETSTGASLLKSWGAENTWP